MIKASGLQPNQSRPNELSGLTFVARFADASPGHRIASVRLGLHAVAPVCAADTVSAPLATILAVPAFETGGALAFA